METNKDIHDELEGLSPELSRIRKMQEKPSFTVPENYFENMPAQMQEYVRNKTRKRTLAWLPNGISQWAPALTILLVAIGVSFYFLSRPETDQVATTTSPSMDTLLANNSVQEEVVLDELDEDFLVESLAMAEPVKPVKSNNGQSKAEAQEEIEDYILDNFDESLLTEEL
jgi:hypothetical protein